MACECLLEETPCTCGGHQEPGSLCHRKLSWRNGQRSIHLANGSVFLGHTYLTCIDKHPSLLSCCRTVGTQTPEWRWLLFSLYSFNLSIDFPSFSMFICSGLLNSVAEVSAPTPWFQSSSLSPLSPNFQSMSPQSLISDRWLQLVASCFIPRTTSDF